MSSSESYYSSEDGYSESYASDEDSSFSEVVTSSESEAEEESDEESGREDENQAESIVNAFDSLFAEQPGVVSMTDVGYRMSRLVLQQQQQPTEPEAPAVEEEEEMERDKLLDRHLEGRRRNRTGVRGRPKKEDHGFGKSTTVSLPPEVARIMGTANQAYVSRDYDRAIPLLLEVIRQSPTSFEPYHTLGYIYEEMEDAGRAYSCYLIAAYLARRDAEQWARLVHMAMQLGRLREALLCLSKQILSTKDRQGTIPLYWQRTRLQIQLGDFNAILACLMPMLRANLTDGILWWRACQLAIRLKLAGQMAQLLLSMLRRCTHALSWEHLGWILELWLAAEEWSRVEETIQEWAPRLAAPLLSTATDWALIGEGERLRRALPLLPAAIQAQQAIAWINAGLKDRVHLSMLTLLLADLPQARLALGMALLGQEQWSEAHEVLEPLLHDPNVGSNELWMAVAKCLRALKRESEALDLVKAVLEWEPDHPEALAFLRHGKVEVEKVDEDLLVFFDRLVEQADIYPAESQAITDGASLLAIPNPRHARKPAHLRRKRRKRVKLVAYTVEQCEQMRRSYELLFQTEPSALLLNLTRPLIEDLLGNGCIRAEKVRHPLLTFRRQRRCR